MTEKVDTEETSNNMDEDELVESDIEQDEIASNDDRSNATTDDDFYNELMDAPLEYEDHLIPDGCKDEIAGIEHLTSCLNRRYNSCPIVFTGSLSDALKEAFDSSDIKERRPLLIYVNNDKSLYSNLFCKQLFCNEKIIEYLLANCVLWAWDVTFESNGLMLNEMFTKTFPQAISEGSIGTQSVDNYPLLLVVYRSTTGNYLFKRLIFGSDQRPVVDEFLGRLIEMKDQFDLHEQNYITMKKTQEEMDARKHLFDLHSADHRTRHHHFDPSTNLFSSIEFDRHLSHNLRAFRHMDDSFFTNIRSNLPNAFRQLNINVNDSDNNDSDDDEQTPTVHCLPPSFPK